MNVENVGQLKQLLRDVPDNAPLMVRKASGEFVEIVSILRREFVVKKGLMSTEVDLELES